MQILSTLTLPTLTHLFSKRPSTDLRRPLQGTEPLLSALADTFTRGSPPTLLSALECLNLRKAHRQVINDTLLQKRCETLLYGLIVAGGRLVSVVRPRRHSLHPSDLQLIFNMLFEAGSIKGGGGENWIPLCLPGFNKNGYLHMYVSFVDSPVTEENEEHQDQPSSHTAESEKEKEKETEKEKEKEKQDEIAILLISANKESFYDLRKMRDTVITDLETNGAMSLIKAAVRRGRPATTDIIPGTVLRHFLYKSRANVQFVMPSYAPYFSTLLARRKLLSLYHTLHASVHAKNAHLKVQNCSSRDSSSLAWTSASFELYCVAGPRVSRNALAQSANMVVQWARREEERVFIIGGAVCVELFTSQKEPFFIFSLGCFFTFRTNKTLAGFLIHPPTIHLFEYSISFNCVCTEVEKTTDSENFHQLDMFILQLPYENYTSRYYMPSVSRISFLLSNIELHIIVRECRITYSAIWEGGPLQ